MLNVYVPHENLKDMSGAEVLAEVRKAGLNSMDFTSKEDAVKALLALAEPDWAHDEPKVKWADETPMGFPANLFTFLGRLNRFFNENQIIWESLQTLVNTKYTTPDEVKKIVEEQLAGIEKRMLENLIAQMNAAETPEKVDDQNVLTSMQQQLATLTARAKKAGWKL